MENMTIKDELKRVIRQLSHRNQEEEWFLNHRLDAFRSFDEADAPVIERLNYANWHLWSLKETLEIYNQTTDSKECKNDEINVTEVDEIIVCSFSKAMREYPELFKKIYSESSFIQTNNRFSAYTLSFLTSGLFIYVPKNTQVEQAIETTFRQLNHKKNISNHQVLIYVESNAKVEIIERYASKEGPAPAKANIYVDIHAAAGAKVNYSAIDQFNQQTTGYIYRTAQVHKDASVKWALAMMNDGHMVEDVFVNLTGDGSATDVKGVAISHRSQIQASNIEVINAAKSTSGNIFQHGVALDEATLTFNGIGHILKNGKNSDAQQESRILMLSEKARADANPILLIDEFEVTAGHAASVSRVDAEQLYYLTSRGIDTKLAEKLIIRGFLGIVLSEISVKSVHDELIETIERKLRTL